MRTFAIISSSLLAITVSSAPVDLPKLPVGLPSLNLPSLPTKVSATILSGLPTGVPSIPEQPSNDIELPVENLPVRRTYLPVVDNALKGVKLPALPTLPKPPTGDLKLPVKRADLPVVDSLLKDVKVPARLKLPVGNIKLPVKRAELPVVNGAVESVKIPNLTTLPTLPKLPVDNVNLPVRRADTPIVDDILKDVTLIDGVDPKVHFPLPINTGLNKKAVDYAVNAPVSVPVDDVVEVPAVNIPPVAVPNIDMPDVNVYQPTVGVRTVALSGLPAGVPSVKDLPKVNLASRDIKQSLPVVGGADVPLDAGNIQIGTADKYVDKVVKGTKVESLPKVAREINQSLPIVGGADIPLDAGKIQVGTVDKYVDKVVKGTTLKDVPVEEVVKGTTVKDLLSVGPRQVKQSLPVVGGVDVPLDAGNIQIGTVDKYVEDVVKDTTTGL